MCYDSLRLAYGAKALGIRAGNGPITSQGFTLFERYDNGSLWLAEVNYMAR
jgi:hypothetical protein